MMDFPFPSDSSNEELPNAFEKLRSKLATTDTPVQRKKSLNIDIRNSEAVLDALAVVMDRHHQQQQHRAQSTSGNDEQFPLLSTRSSSTRDLKVLEKAKIPATSKSSWQRNRRGDVYKMTRQNSRGSILEEERSGTSAHGRLTKQLSENELSASPSPTTVLLSPVKASRGRMQASSPRQTRSRSKSMDRSSSHHSTRMIIKDRRSLDDGNHADAGPSSPGPRRGRRPQIHSSHSCADVMMEEERGRPRSRSRSTTCSSKQRSKSLDLSKSSCRRGSASGSTRDPDSSDGVFEIISMSPRRGRKPVSTAATNSGAPSDLSVFIGRGSMRRSGNAGSRRSLNLSDHQSGISSTSKGEEISPLARRRRMRRGENGSKLDTTNDQGSLSSSSERACMVETTLAFSSSSSFRRRSCMSRTSSGKSIHADSDHIINGSSNHSSASRRRRVSQRFETSTKSKDGNCGDPEEDQRMRESSEHSRRRSRSKSGGRRRSKSADRRLSLSGHGREALDRPLRRRAYKSTAQ